MAQQLDDKPESSETAGAAPGAPKPTPHRGRCVRFGVIGGLLGGILGGAIGGGAGGPIGSHMRGPVAIIDMPPGEEFALGLLTGALFGAVAGAFLGAPGGWLVGRLSGRWTAFSAMLFSAFCAAATAPIEASHAGVLASAAGFVLGMSALTLLGLAVVAAVRALYRWRQLRWLAATWLLLCLGGAVYNNTLPAPTFTPSAARPTEPVVQLRCASLPSLDLVARHCFFAAYDPADRHWHRWELWQTKGKDRNSWGHLRKDLMHVDAGVGGGPSQILEEWRGEQARALLTALDTARTKYEHRDCYIAWPGPNCNTYVVWVLNEANVSSEVHPLAVGQHYDGALGASRTTSGTGVQVETASGGGRIGLREGVEVHVLTMPFGVAILAPALTTPFGRCGFPK
jgi:hypothetical protein